MEENQALTAMQQVSGLRGQNTSFFERPSFSLANPNEKKHRPLQLPTSLKGDNMVGFCAGQFVTLC